jgi:hypothetical protein
MMTNRVGLSVQSKWAILYILAHRPGGQATFDELEREMKGLGERAEQTDKWSEFVELADIDVFRSDLVSCDEQGSFRITEAGQSLLRAIEDVPEHSANAATDRRTQRLKLINTLKGAKKRSKFDSVRQAHDEKLDVRSLDEETTLDGEIGNQTAVGSRVPTQGVRNFDHADTIDSPVAIQDCAPALLKPSFASASKGLERSFWRFNPTTSIASGFKRVLRILRGHVEVDTSGIKIPKDRAVGIGGAVLALLSLLVIVVAGGAVIAVNQIKSMTAEIATLQRELVVIKNQAARWEAAESKREADRNDDQGRTGTEKTDGSGQSRQAASALSLSPDEIRAIKEYIKPAPIAGEAISPSFSVGDHMTEATTPVPSPLTDKVPKLVGARFTIRNGAIVIIKRDSHQVDAVLGPN